MEKSSKSAKIETQNNKKQFKITIEPSSIINNINKLKGKLNNLIPENDIKNLKTPNNYGSNDRPIAR